MARSEPAATLDDVKKRNDAFSKVAAPGVEGRNFFEVETCKKWRRRFDNTIHVGRRTSFFVASEVLDNARRFYVMSAAPEGPIVRAVSASGAPLELFDTMADAQIAARQAAREDR